MHILCLQHDPLDGPGTIVEWADSRGHCLSILLICQGEPIPHPDTFDLLISLGGPMGAYEEEENPWLKHEKQLLQDAFASGKKILGLCLGCQLLAEALGGKAFRHTCKEFGWQPIEPTAEGRKWFGVGESECTFFAFQWHGDTYTLPPEAVQLARNPACEQQAFVIGDQAVGLQFHLEWTEAMAVDALASPGALPPPSRFVQTPKEVLADPTLFTTGKKRFFALMDRLVSIES